MSILMRIVTIITGAALFLTPVFISKMTADAICEGVVINLADSSKHQFVTNNDIMNALRATGIRVTGQKIRDIPLTKLEERVKAFTELRVAEVYISEDMKLHVYGNQREPVMRVMASYGGDFFIDREGVIMRRHNLYTPNLHILEIDMVFNSEQMTGTNIFESEKTANLAQAFELVNYIRGDSFWNGMIDQLSMSRDGRVTLVPHVGNHTVKMGRVENYEEKLHNLRVFYRQAMPVAGWDRYRVINVEYKGQVVCQRR
ncbi:MAG TPA: cell division protein FtsQ/DivIB [Bacteroidales bacterium]|nr:cell division protein FtsQ/DivIB [Bacteroidales bacterium]HMT66713.1 cell division protein FtsQ/DivIB [Bacteroidales bacterium]HPO39379.1 cell division protein FtsQ/DivIB [Bacteroidales bacterium]